MASLVKNKDSKTKKQFLWAATMSFVFKKKEKKQGYAVHFHSQFLKQYIVAN